VSLSDLAAGVAFVAIVAYSVFGGADFGAGVWTALASGPRRREQREAIFRAMGPVWETNHIWLILLVVTLFTAFPHFFAQLFVTLLVPLTVALVGIVFRGAAFAFRHYGEENAPRLPATVAVFSVSSLLAPFAMATGVGVVASGRAHIEHGEVTSGSYWAWVHPFPIMAGIIALAICAFLTAAYMTTRTEGALREDFRLRALAASLALGAITAVALPVAAWDAPDFFDRLSEPAPLPIMAVAVVMGLTSLLVLWRRWWLLAPPVAAATATLVIAGWGAAQYPFAAIPDVHIDEVAAPDATLRAFLVALPFGALILVPSLVWLYLTFRGPTMEETAAGTSSSPGRGPR